jgi:DeoR family transcriptional regulator of aga operon
MNRAARLGRIMERLSENGNVDVVDLAGALDVSVATVRRDLQALHEQRLLERTHGGAVSISTLAELPMRYRGSRRRDEKQRIAHAALAHVRDGMSVALTGGSTTTEVARALLARTDLTIVTNAVNIAAELAVRQDIRLVVTGGVARAASFELVGPLAEHVLEQINVDVAFIGVDGISARGGLTTHREVEAHTNRTMLERADRVFVVADSSKIGRTLLARIAGCEDAGGLITTVGADPAEREAIAAAGVAIEEV